MQLVAVKYRPGKFLAIVDVDVSTMIVCNSEKGRLWFCCCKVAPQRVPDAVCRTMGRKFGCWRERHKGSGKWKGKNMREAADDSEEPAVRLQSGPHTPEPMKSRPASQQLPCSWETLSDAQAT